MQTNMHNFPKNINEIEDKKLEEVRNQRNFLDIFKIFSKITHFQSLENLLTSNLSFSITK